MSPLTLAKLEELGCVAVAKLLAQHEYGVPGSELRSDVETWLHVKPLEANARREAREEEANSIARAAAATAVRASRWAMYAAIIAVLAASISIKSQIRSLTSRFL